MQHNAAKLLVDASDAGLHITGLDGWTQTRLAKTLAIRRETLNAIINRSPGSEPTEERPRMIEACQKLITFAVALSAKDDAVLKLPVDAGNLQSDDGQAYEHHRLRLHRLVEAAALDNQFTDALCRLGEFASAALHAPDEFRLRMICNLVTAIQRLLDKPASRDVPAAVLRANLSRLYRAERAARSIARRRKADTAAREQLHYVRGQAGYGLVFSGMLLSESRLIQRGGERLFRAAKNQPDPSYGHWCNLLRATNDLLSGCPEVGQAWAGRALPAAVAQAGHGFAVAYASLEARGEIARLRTYWNQRSDRSTIAKLIDATGPKAVRPCTPRAMAWIGAILLTAASLAGLPAMAAGDGRDFKAAQPGAPTTNPPRAALPSTPLARGARDETVHTGKNPPRRHMGIDLDREATTNGSASPVDPDANSSLASLVQATSPEDAWGENLKSYRKFVKPTPRETPPEKPAGGAEARPMPKPALGSTDPIDKAASALGMVRNYLAAGNDAIARQKIQELLKAYPETPAAMEAKGLLQQMVGK